RGCRSNARAKRAASGELHARARDQLGARVGQPAVREVGAGTAVAVQPEPAGFASGAAAGTEPAANARTAAQVDNAHHVSKPRVVVVGLGPAGIDLLLPAARHAIERIPARYVRTARHPVVDDLAREGLALEPLDVLYDAGDDLDTVYAAI